MTKSKTRVRHLTLAPGSDLREAVDVGNQVKEDDEYRRMLQREQMARATEISVRWTRKASKATHSWSGTCERAQILGGW
jgi:hypothetical protein